ncbi:MAG: STAS domain-containing protein [Gaiella sp.]
MTESAQHEHDFRVQTSTRGDVSVVAVAGQADLHTAPELRSALAEVVDGGARRVLVDLSETTFLDSMTLGVLLGALKRLQAVSGRIAVACPDEHIRRVFEITSLEAVLDVHATTDAAFRAIATESP